MAAEWLSTDLNHATDPTHILFPDGSRFRGRGANIHDTRSCDACTVSPADVGEVLRRIDELVDVWGANFLRLVLESYPSDGGFRAQWMGVLDDPGYLADLRMIVSHIGTKPGTYVLVSLWADPTFTPSQDPAQPPDPTKPEGGWPTLVPIPPNLHSTKEVWEKLASTFAMDSHVLLGICNEPERNSDGTRDAEVWTAINAVVDIIRAAETAAGAISHATMPCPERDSAGPGFVFGPGVCAVMNLFTSAQPSYMCRCSSARNTACGPDPIRFTRRAYWRISCGTMPFTSKFTTLSLMRRAHAGRRKRS
jgi:hypothetical protein